MGGERDLVSAASSHSVYVHPADFAQNLSTLTNFEVEVLEQKSGEEEREGAAENVHTVAFLMSDGDNVQWLLDDFATSENWFASPQRGRVDLGWTISPALSELAPTVMKHLYEEAADEPSGSDYFVAAPSGVGYMYPNLFPALDTAAAQLNRYMEKADLSIVNVIGRNPDGSYLRPYLEQPDVDAIFYLDYASYANPAGRLRWINEKPVVGARYDFREETNSVEELAAKLNEAATTPGTEAGYSLVTVHVWSRSVEDVVRVAERLDADVEVVRPDVFVRRLQANVDR